MPRTVDEAKGRNEKVGNGQRKQTQARKSKTGTLQGKGTRAPPPRQRGRNEAEDGVAAERGKETPKGKRSGKTQQRQRRGRCSGLRTALVRPGAARDKTWTVSEAGRSGAGGDAPDKQRSEARQSKGEGREGREVEG